jgi:hypothetical protein
MRTPLCLLSLLVSLHLLPSEAEAHHAGHQLLLPVTNCGWAEGDSLRDRSNLSEFCARSVPEGLRITGAGAEREHLWLEAPAALALALRDRDAATAALLREWLGRWRAISGYRTAAITLVHNHTEVARVYTTMAGDVVAVR